MATPEGDLHLVLLAAIAAFKGPKRERELGQAYPIEDNTNSVYTA